jgi:hypothetical protein
LMRITATSVNCLCHEAGRRCRSPRLHRPRHADWLEA